MAKSDQTRLSYRNSCTWYKAVFATCILLGVVGLSLISLGMTNEGNVVFLHQSGNPETTASVAEAPVETIVVADTQVRPSLEEQLLQSLRSLQGPESETVQTRNEWQVVRMKVTAYCPCRICCGKHSDGYTACNHHIRPGDAFVAADKMMPFGTEIIIPGYNGDRPVPVLDRGRLIKGNRLDVFMHSHQEAREWGCQELDVLVRMDTNR